MANKEEMQVDWTKVAVYSVTLAAVPWLLGLWSRHALKREAANKWTSTWTDRNRWE